MRCGDLPSSGSRLALALPLTLALSGTLGAAIHASGLYTPTPRPDGGGSALNTLLALLTAVFALEAAYWAWGPPLQSPARGVCAARCRVGVSALLLITTPLLAILFAVGFRPDASAWCVPLLLALALPIRVQLRTLTGDEKVSADVSSPRLLEEEGEGEAEAEAAVAAPTATSLSECRSCCCPPAGTPRVRCAAFFAHSCVWGASVGVLVLLLGGAGTIASGWHRFPPRGTIYNLPALSDTPAMRVHAWCSGVSKNASAPTVWLEFGGGGHSSSDVLGLQLALNAIGRRVCVNDPPGTGWSPLQSDATRLDDNAPARLHALMTAMHEDGPFLLIGSMDGGAARIYSFALAFPELVAGLVPMQYNSGEFDGWAAWHGLAVDDDRVIAYARSQVAPRLVMCDVIRFLGVPWGLIPLFAPSSGRFIPADAQEECHFLNLFHEGQWDMQCRILAEQVAHPAALVARDVWETHRSLAPHIPVLALGNFPADPCVSAGLDGGSDACAILRLGQMRATAFMVNMTTMTPGSRYANLCPTGGAPVCLDWAGGGATVPAVVAAVVAWGV